VKIIRGDIPAVEYQVIMLLRLLLSGKEELARVDLLSDHVDKLTQVEREVYGAGVVKVIRDGLKFGNWTEEQLLRYISIIRTNACMLSLGPGRGTLRILHPSMSTMNHSCFVNTRVFQRPDNSLCVRAKVNICSGEEVTLMYTSIFQGKLERDTLLPSSWHFSCKCLRCRDPTDLGTNTDSLFCLVGSCGGLLLPKIGEDSKVENWECQKCEQKKSRIEVEDMEAIIEEAILSRCGNLRALEMLLSEQISTLHPNHHLIIKLKVQIVIEYGKLMETQAQTGKSWSLKQVRGKVELCRNILAALDIIDPGLSDTRGQINFEMAAPQFMLLQHGLGTGKMEKQQVQEGMEELITLLEDVLCHLEVFEESKEIDMVSRARQLYKDAKTFQKQALM